jgi:mono/diheme cytochrome c family protein
MMRFRPIIFGAIVILVLLALGGFAWTWRPAIAPIAMSDRPSADEQTYRRGAELALIGDCNVCHVGDSGKAYAGGQSIPTPFGTIFATNITPDTETGIGGWSEAAFQRAMREGVDREGRQLYPAFPYDHFTKTTNDDNHALYAYLMSQPPVRNAIPANELAFPLNFRPVVAGWKILFFRETSLQKDDSRSEEWNRGRYLVEGLGHCGSCHTPRNIFGAEEHSRAYAGGVAEGWDAPPLNSNPYAPDKWTADQLTEYLSTGWHQLHGAAAGPMEDITDNLAVASTHDVRAMAVYIASLSAQSEGGNSAVAPRDGHHVTGAFAEIIPIYTGACANCHNDQVDVGPSKAISLSLSSALREPGSANAVRVILDGVQPRPGFSGAYMPAFGSMFTDQQIASLAEYARARYTDQPPWTDVRQEIAKARQGGS